MFRYPSELTFFGLTSNYRSIVFQQIHDLVYHGNGGFVHSEVYNMPIWLRQYHITTINDVHKKQDDERKRIEGKQQMGDDKKVYRPNIDPSNTYNF